MGDEKILETKVVEEKVLSTPQAPNSARSRIGVAILIVAIGGAGYSTHYIQERTGYISKAATVRVVQQAGEKGYFPEMWTAIPDKEKTNLIRHELDSMPVEKSWEIVRPSYMKKAEKMYDSVKKDTKFMYETLRQYLRGD